MRVLRTAHHCGLCGQSVGREPAPETGVGAAATSALKCIHFLSANPHRALAGKPEVTHLMAWPTPLCHARFDRASIDPRVKPKDDPGKMNLSCPT